MMRSEYYPVFITHTERQKDLLRREGEARTARRLRSEAREAADPSRRFEGSLSRFMRDALKLALRAPRLSRSLLRFAAIQRRGARLRAAWESKGLHVPPLLIASVTEACNLRCRGCYAMAHRRGAASELQVTRWSGLFREASQLGISFVLVAGGEPLARWEVIEAAGTVPATLFAVFTNGLLLGPHAVEVIRECGNIVPIVSLEGPEADTDGRRGPGVYRRVRQAMERLRRAGVLFGASITVTSANLERVTDRSFIGSLLDAGCRLVAFVEYTPVQEGTEALAPTAEQRAELDRRVRDFHRRGRALFISFPGEEEQYGGCLAAGRGFVHVSAQGRLEPCPFAPYSDTSVRELGLREALQSPLLAGIRAAHAELTETRGGCALWARRQWVQQLLARSKAAGEPTATVDACERVAV